MAKRVRQWKNGARKLSKQSVAPSNLRFKSKTAPIEKTPWDVKSKGNSQILSQEETKRNIPKRGFGNGTYIETEVTEGTMVRFRTEKDRELSQIQRRREDYEPIMITEEIQTSAGNLDMQEDKEWQSLIR